MNAILYGLLLTVALTAPIEPHDPNTHGFLRIARYDSTPRMVKDIIQNLVIFAPFGLLLRRALRRSACESRFELLMSALIAATFALTMESIQSVIPGRYSSLIDVGLDAVGAALGAGLDPLLRGRLAPAESLID